MAEHGNLLTAIGPTSVDFKTNGEFTTSSELKIAELTMQRAYWNSKLQGLSSDLPADSEDKANIQREINNIEEFIKLYSQLVRLRVNMYEDVSIDDDSCQFIINTVGDLISAKNIKAGERSIQCVGHLSDESLQMMSKECISRVPYSATHNTHPSQPNFRGAGRRLDGS